MNVEEGDGPGGAAFKAGDGVIVVEPDQQPMRQHIPVVVHLL